MDIPTEEQVLGTIEEFLDRHGMKPTRFGALATGEPQLISSIRKGRSPSLKVLQRIRTFMAEKDAELGCADHGATDTARGDASSSGSAGEVSAPDEAEAA